MSSDPRLEAPDPVVLIVDDHPDTADLLAEYLRFVGVRALRAEHVPEAREVLEQEERVDVVVTDYAMPGEDGLAFVASLRASERWAELPVVMVSGHDHDGEIARAARRHGAEFVRKPFDLDALVAAVRGALGRARDRATAPRPDRDRETERVPPLPPTAPPPVSRRGDVVEIPSSKRDPRREPDD